MYRIDQLRDVPILPSLFREGIFFKHRWIRNRAKHRKSVVAAHGNSRLLLPSTTNDTIVSIMTETNPCQTRTEFQLSVQDCIEGIRALPSESVDLVVTSPPYNVGVRYNSYDDRKSHNDYLRWALAWATEIKRVLKPNGSFFLNVGTVPSKPMLPHELLLKLSTLFALQNTFHWIKSISIQKPAGEPLTVGHFKPINSRRFVNSCHEYVFHLTKSSTTPLDRLSLGVPYADKSNVRRWTHTKGRDVRCRGNAWFIPYKTIRNRKSQRPHPATFPTELAVNCIKIHGNPFGTVMLDPFLGIGHSAVAARQLGIRKFIGFDMDAEYVELARRNIHSHGAANFSGGSSLATDITDPRKVAQQRKT